MIFPAPKTLIQRAERETGYSDWNTAYTDPLFRTLQVLVEDLNTTAKLHELGAKRLQRRLHEMLCARLRYIADRKRFPQIESEEIDAPVFILGLPRSGTTFLHNLLAADPDNRAPRTYEMLFPSPKIEDDEFEKELRIQRCHESLQYLGVMDEDWQACHPFGAARAEECIFIWDLSLISFMLFSVCEAPRYEELMFSADFHQLYREHHAFLQYLQHRRPSQRWILKTPIHVNYLDKLFAVYPDARILHCHRDPAKVYPSIARTIAVGRRKFSDRLPQADAGTKMYDESWRSALSFRERPGMAQRFMDVHFLDMQADPIAMVESIYDKFDIELSADRKNVLKSWLDRDRAEHAKRPRHHYDLAEFGLNLQDIDKSTGDYVRAFNVALER